MQKTLSFQPLHSSLWSRALLSEDRGQSSYRTTPIEDKDRFAVTNLVDKCAEMVLGLSESGCFHMARIANLNFTFKLSEQAQRTSDLGDTGSWVGG
jgi:hypothetical protein